MAELPICQKTLHSEAPLTSSTVLLEAVVSDESVWKMKTASALPAAVEDERAGELQGAAARRPQ